MPSQTLTEASLNSRCHLLQVVVSDSPVEPGDLNSFLAASLDDFQCRFNSGNPCGVISIEWVNKVVLHVDHNQDRVTRVNHEAGVVAAFFIALEDHFLLRTPR